MPTMNKVDLMDCANGHHNFEDDSSRCSVCGHERLEPYEDIDHQAESHGVEVWLCATIYVKAESEEAAETIVAEQAGTRDRSEGLELAARDITLYDFADGAVMSPPVSLYGLAHHSKLVAVADPVRDAADDLLAVLRRALDEWPQFDTDSAPLAPGCIAEEAEPVNGGDMVEWFGEWREAVKAVIAKAEGGAA